MKEPRRWAHFLRIAIPCFIVLIMMTLVALHLSIQSHINHFTSQLENNAEVAKERIQSSLRNAENNLSLTKRTVEKHGVFMLPESNKLGMDVSEIAKLDHLGTAVLATDSTVVETNSVAMRMYNLKRIIKAHELDPSDDSRMMCNSNHQFFLSQRVNDSGGGFTGAVTTELSAHRFNDVTQKLSLQQNTLFTMSHGGHVHYLADKNFSTDYDEGSFFAKLLSSVYNTEPLIKIDKSVGFTFFVHAQGNILSYVQNKVKEQTSLLVLFLACLGFLAWLSWRLANGESKLQNQEKQTVRLATRDQLTGVFNRHVLETEFEKFAESVNHNNITVLCVDLDNFKSVNDVLGHNVGDEMLKITTERVLNLLEEDEVPVRLGGDEFAILVPTGIDEGGLDEQELNRSGKSVERVKELSTKLLNSLQRPVTVDEHELAVTASIGIAHYPEHGRDIETLLKAADNALYEAKMKGRNTAVVFNEAMQERANAKLKFSQAFRAALKNSKIGLIYIPVFDAQKQIISNFDVAPKWDDPTHGTIMINEHTGMAHDFGLLNELGKYVFEQSCIAVRNANTTVNLTVEVEPSQLTDADTAASFMHTLRRTEVNAERITLEVTQKRLISIDKIGKERLQSLNNLGLKIAINNYGDSASSLNDMIDNPVSRISLASSLVDKILDSDKHHQLAEKIIDFAISQNIDVVADGVTSKEQVQKLMAMGCSQFKGPHIGDPRLISDFQTTIKEIMWNLEYEGQQVA